MSEGESDRASERDEPSAAVDRGRSDGQTPRTVARVLLVGLLILVPVMVGWIAVDLLEVRRGLTHARASLGEVAGALGEVDIDDARLALTDAEASLERATSRTGSLRWSVASVLPVVGHSIEVTRDVTRTADSAVGIASVALDDGAGIIARGLDVEVIGGQVDLGPLLEAQALVDRLPVGDLENAHAQLSEPPTGYVPGILLDARAETLELADAMVETVTRARALTGSLPGFLGVDEPRRYFVGMQTSAELRGTGGLIGYWGVLGVDDGRITFGETEVHEAQDETDGARTGRIGRLGGPYEVGVRTDPAYHQRYAALLGISSFSNINLDPDLPTTARVALDLFALRTGEQLDGMILLDPVGMQHLLEATGSPLPVSERTSDVFDLEGAMRVEDFAQFVTADVYETLGFGQDQERSEVLRELGDAAFLQIFDGAWDGVAMARAIAQASAQRHLQVFSEQEMEQQAFADIGVAGTLMAPDDADLLAVSANNAVGGKQDVHLGHEFEVDVRLEMVGRADDGRHVASRSVSLGVHVDNPLVPDDRDEYVVGNCFVVGERNRCFEGPPAWNWTWFNAWLPSDSRVDEVRTSDDSMDPAGPHSYRDFQVIDHFHATPPESRSGYQIDFEGTAPLQRTASGYVYEWRWWRQAKAIPDLLDVQVHPPEGWAVEEVEVVGGGEGRGMGVYTDGVALRAEVEDGIARLHGTVDAHTALRVHLARNGGP